jgi:hypothetical protein
MSLFTGVEESPASRYFDSAYDILFATNGCIFLCKVRNLSLSFFNIIVLARNNAKFQAVV